MVRKAAATAFYNGDCARMARRFLDGFTPPPEPPHPVAAIVPHAGWIYSGAVAAHTYEALRRSAPSVFVIFGAVHYHIRKNSVYPRGWWETPLGPVAVDEKLAAEIVAECPDLVAADAAAHDREHAIEVQLPFLRLLFPEARMVPISVLPDEKAAELGRRVGALLQRRANGTVVVGSSDLTHYGDEYGFTPAGYGATGHDWMRANDAHLLRTIQQMRAEDIVAEVRQHHNACGAGAIAATVAAAKALGAKQGRVIEYTTSFEVAPRPPFTMGVGYAGVLF